MLKIKLFALVCLINVFAISLNAQTIHFEFANDVLIDSSNGKDYFAFDIMASATSATKFKVAQIYIYYNTSAFGTNIVKNNKVTYTYAGSDLELLWPKIGTGGQIGNYEPSLNDNSPSVFAIQNIWYKSGTGSATGYDLSNTLGTTPKKYVRVTMEITNPNQVSALSFVNTIDQWDQQDYYFSSGNTTAKYSSVTYGPDLDKPLPIELASFTAKAGKDGILLKWKTETEVNNYGFEIEKSSTGGLHDFKNIGFVEGSGNSNSPKEYSYLDEGIRYGKHSYRFKQVDNDGRYEYSNIIEVDAGNIPNGFILEQNYPNPFNPSTTFRFAMDESVHATLKIYDAIGNEIEEVFNEQVEANKVYDIKFNAINLASGIYYFRLTADDRSAVKKMLLLK